MGEEKRRPVVVGITGATGSALARATVDLLLEERVPVIATATRSARAVWREEMGEPFKAALERWTERGSFTYYPPEDMTAPIASGTYPVLGMALVPCSMNTVAAVALGLAPNLVCRAADVCLKERRPLVVVPRETPLRAVHLENLAALARQGATVLPPEPAFYLGHATIEDLVSFVARRTLVALGVWTALPGEATYRGPRGR